MSLSLLYVDVFNPYKISHKYLINFGRLINFFYLYAVERPCLVLLLFFLYRCRHLYTILYATQYLNVKPLRTFLVFAL